MSPGHLHKRLLGMMLVAITVTLPAIRVAAEIRNWHDASFDTRVIVRVDRPVQSDIDTAHVRITHAGLAQPDGDDFRVFDTAGKPVPYELLYHTSDRDSLIAFEVQGEAGDYAIYFNNPDAARDPLRVNSAKAVAAGKADEGWLPRAGLVLTTMRRPRDTPNPMTEAEMRDMIKQSPRIDGGGWVPNISHGVNPYGDSDHYISIYRGWLRIPRDGTYVFCTASNEASFSFLNARELIHWPGRHTEQRGKLGQKQATHQLKAGLYFVEYLHEEVLLYQTAFLGWKKPGDKHLWSIPDEMFPRPHEAVVQSYEDRNAGLFAMPRVQLVDSLWPTRQSSGQWTRYRFTADAGAAVETQGNRWALSWDFGDGQTAEGHEVDHLYLSEGTRPAKLHVKNPQGQTLTFKLPVTVFPIEHVDDGIFKEGDFKTYRELAESMRVERLQPEDLQWLLVMYQQAGEHGRADAVAKRLLDQSNLTADQLVEAHLALAGDAGKPAWMWMRPDDATTDQAAREHLKQALAASDDPAGRITLLSRLIRLDGSQDQPVKPYDQQARQLQTRIEDASQRTTAFRKVVVAMGDVAWWFKQNEDQARTFYTTAEGLNQPVIPPQVRVAQIGGFPETMHQFTQAGDTKQALASVDRWQQVFPADQLRGDVLFERARLLANDESNVSNRVVVRLLNQAIPQAEGSPWEAEARYRLAQAYRQLGDKANYHATLQALIDTGLVSTWRDRAIQEMP